MRGFRWLFVLALLGALVWAALRIIGPVRAAISPAGIEAQMRMALGVPVSVGSTELQYAPSPRLVIRDMTAQSGFRLPEVALHFNWRDAIHGLQTASWVLGEARVAPLKLPGGEAMALLQSVRGASRLPAAVTTVRFESLEFPDLVLLPGRYEAVIRRGVGQKEFGSVDLKRLDVPGQVDLEIVMPASAGGDARFALYATNFAVPAGPAIVWREATAQGSFRADALIVDTYSVGSSFGTLNGAARLVREGSGWRLAGNLRGANVSVEDLLRAAAGAPASGEGAAARRIAFRGIARFDLAATGTGTSVAEVLQRAVVSGPLTIDSGALDGANLGLAATQRDLGPAGGSTRFTELAANVLGSDNGVVLRSISGRSGGLKVLGSLNVDRKLSLSGSLRSEVASPRGVASAETRLGGTVLAPTYRF